MYTFTEFLPFQILYQVVHSSSYQLHLLGQVILHTIIRFLKCTPFKLHLQIALHFRLFSYFPLPIKVDVYKRQHTVTHFIQFTIAKVYF